MCKFMVTVSAKSRTFYKFPILYVIYSYSLTAGIECKCQRIAHWTLSSAYRKPSVIVVRGLVLFSDFNQILE